MQNSHLTIFIIVLTAIPALSQERSRFFDNFDTSHGVQVVKPAYVQTAIRSAAKDATPTGKVKIVNGKRYLMPTGMSTPVNHPNRSNARTGRMNVSEGLADRDIANFTGNKPTTPTLLGSSANLKGFTTGDMLIDSYIVDSSRRYGIDPLLIYSQMHQESSFKIRATSYKGASGSMQLMPGTARRLGVANIYDPKQNIDGGVKYMRMLLDMFNGDVNLALAGYNAGEGAVMKFGNSIPPYSETREYVRRISARYASISDGTFAQNYRRVSSAQASKLEKKEARPLTVYEPNAVAIRLADGRMRLVNQ